MKVIGFAGSSSKNSINKKLVAYTLSLFRQVQTELLDLNDYEVAIYSEDKEKATGIPLKINTLAQKLDTADLLVISLAEHNGAYTSAYKNIYDWLSRVPNRKVFSEIPVVLMATSPGKRGGKSVLEMAKERLPRDGSEILMSYSLPHFHDNFNEKEGVTATKLRLELIRKINALMASHLGVQTKDHFTCGINPSVNDCGDATDY